MQSLQPPPPPPLGSRANSTDVSAHAEPSQTAAPAIRGAQLGSSRAGDSKRKRTGWGALTVWYRPSSGQSKRSKNGVAAVTAAADAGWRQSGPGLLQTDKRTPFIRQRADT